MLEVRERERERRGGTKGEKKRQAQRPALEVNRVKEKKVSAKCFLTCSRRAREREGERERKKERERTERGQR